MKKWMLSLAIISSLALAACGDSSSEGKTASKKEKDVEITLPAELFEDETEASIMEAAEEDGIKKVVIEEDGAVTYTMSSQAHEEMLEEIKADMAKSVEEIVTDEDYTSIQEISYNGDFTKYDLVVDREAYENSFDSMAIFGLIISSTYYKMFEGVNDENVKITFNYIDAETNEVYDTSIYPDDMEDSLE